VPSFTRCGGCLLIAATRKSSFTGVAEPIRVIALSSGTRNSMTC
jgi:hypothetical protein